MNSLQMPGMYTPPIPTGAMPNTADTAMYQSPMAGGSLPYQPYQNVYPPAIPMATNQGAFAQPMPNGPDPYTAEIVNNYPSYNMPNPVIYPPIPYGPPQDMYMPTNYTPVPMVSPSVMMPANYPQGQAPSGFAPMNVSGPPPQQLGPSQNHWVA